MFPQAELSFSFPFGSGFFTVIRQTFFPDFSGFIVNIFFRCIDPVENHHLNDRHQIRTDPVNSDPRRNKKRKIQGKQYQKNGHTPLLQLSLFPLKHICPVLVKAQSQCTERGKDRNDPKDPRFFDGRGFCQPDPQKIQAHSPDLFNRFRCQQSGIPDRFCDFIAVESFDGLQFRGIAAEYGAEHFADKGNYRSSRVLRDPEKVLQRMIDHLDQTENDRNLQNCRQAANSRAVTFPFKQFILFFGDAFFVSGIKTFDLIYFRLEFYHLDGIFLD